MVPSTAASGAGLVFVLAVSGTASLIAFVWAVAWTASLTESAECNLMDHGIGVPFTSPSPLNERQRECEDAGEWVRSLIGTVLKAEWCVVAVSLGGLSALSEVHELSVSEIGMLWSLCWVLSMLYIYFDHDPYPPMGFSGLLIPGPCSGLPCGDSGREGPSCSNLAVLLCATGY